MIRFLLASAIIVVTTCIGVDYGAALTASEDKAVKSPQVAKARACISDLATAGRNAGVETDQNGGNILLEDPTEKAKLGKLMGDMFSCLDAAFGMTRKKIERFPKNPTAGSRSWIWYVAIDDNYVSCASPGDATPDAVGYLAGNGPKKDWFAIAFQCTVDKKILGWYKPST